MKRSALTVALLSLTILSACGGLEKDVNPPKLPEVNLQQQSHDVYFAQGATAMEASEQVMLKRFIADSGNLTHAEVTLLTGANPAAQAQLEAVTGILQQHGVARDTVQWHYQPGSDGTVRVQLETATLKTPEPCPDWRDDPTSNHYNKNMGNLGCAYWTVVSKQIADPRDLVRGEGEVAQDPYRNTIAIERYRTMQPLGGAAESSVMSDAGTGGE